LRLPVLWELVCLHAPSPSLSCSLPQVLVVLVLVDMQGGPTRAHGCPVFDVTSFCFFLPSTTSMKPNLKVTICDFAHASATKHTDPTS